jgi:V/A-type H+/Na+-transporting ATPase subunit I
VITLAGPVEQPLFWLLIIVVGNVFAIVLEGLVVFVQTTRLVLFEFFIHFLRADGRIFQPVLRPPAATL